MAQKVKNWALTHRAVYDERTGKLVQKKKQIAEPLRELVKTIAEVQEGTFQLDRENDELTKALKNKEHTGQTRGLGSAIS
jgi:methyl coenzyme M reductase gamma subunit